MRQLLDPTWVLKAAGALMKDAVIALLSWSTAVEKWVNKPAVPLI